MTFNEATFKVFYLENFTAVRTYLLAKCGDIDLAQDLTQESFIRLWNNAKNIDGEKGKSFVYTVANNLFIDHVRHNKVIINYKNAFKISHHIPDPQFELEAKEFLNHINYTLSKMSEGAREVFLMHRIEKLTYSEIAERLSLSVKAIEKRMQKALEVYNTLKNI